MKFEFPGFNNSKVIVEIHFDEDNKSIHILDRKECRNTSLTQKMDRNFQLQILGKLIVIKK
jgi:hypothetical protein